MQMWTLHLPIGVHSAYASDLLASGLVDHHVMRANFCAHAQTVLSLQRFPELTSVLRGCMRYAAVHQPMHLCDGHHVEAS